MMCFIGDHEHLHGPLLGLQSQSEGPECRVHLLNVLQATGEVQVYVPLISRGIDHGHAQLVVAVPEAGGQQVEGFVFQYEVVRPHIHPPLSTEGSAAERIARGNERQHGDLPHLQPAGDPPL